MALIACPECGKSVSSAAPQCIGCGHPIATAVQTLTAQPPASYERPRSTGLPLCGKCGTDSLRKLSVVHAGGMSLTEGDTRGVGISLGGSIGFGAAKTTAATQTALSAIAQPPERKKINTWIAIFGLFGFVLVVGGLSDPTAREGIAGGVVLFGGFCYYVYRIMKFNRETFPALYQRWERSYMCDRCGGIVVL